MPAYYLHAACTVRRSRDSQLHHRHRVGQGVRGQHLGGGHHVHANLSRDTKELLCENDTH